MSYHLWTSFSHWWYEALWVVEELWCLYQLLALHLSSHTFNAQFECRGALLVSTLYQFKCFSRHLDVAFTIFVPIFEALAIQFLLTYEFAIIIINRICINIFPIDIRSLSILMLHRNNTCFIGIWKLHFLILFNTGHDIS